LWNVKTDDLLDSLKGVLFVCRANVLFAMVMFMRSSSDETLKCVLSFFPDVPVIFGRTSPFELGCTRVVWRLFLNLLLGIDGRAFNSRVKDGFSLSSDF